MQSCHNLNTAAALDAKTNEAMLLQCFKTEWLHLVSTVYGISINKYICILNYKANI